MGLLEGKTRLTINANDRIGVLGEISNVFRDLSLNITSIVTTPMKNGKKELVIRADVVDKKELLVEKLREKGFEVTHITEIGWLVAERVFFEGYSLDIAKLAKKW